MKKTLIAIALVAMSSNALAGGSRASDLSSYTDAIANAWDDHEYKTPKWQTPKRSRQPETLTVRSINNHSGDNFYKRFTFRRDNGRVYELDVEPQLFDGYKLNSIGTTTFDARDRRTGEKVKLKVPQSAWNLSR